jgi:selenocysteine lyase/cysteine desulfurase
MAPLNELSSRRDNEQRTTFSVSGSAAYTRLLPLLPSTWEDNSPYNGKANNNTHKQASIKTSDDSIDFLWENAPRHETKAIRDAVKVYSHLPNGTNILDSKWVLARLLLGQAETANNNTESDSLLAVLQSHCFKGRSGFEQLCGRLQLLNVEDNREPATEAPKFRDLVDSYDSGANKAYTVPQPPRLWVLKDAMSNGAGGIWVVGPENVAQFLDASTTPLIENHSYVAQQYTWPPVLYQGRKCHVRVYACFASDGRVFVHDDCFLHVANDAFSVTAKNEKEKGYAFCDSVHITNCCANSHDPARFAGEICASLAQDEPMNGSLVGQQPVVSLKQFAPSIRASIVALAQRTFPFLQGGQANNGFEYLGMDFILSYAGEDQSSPIAYLLEVNAPPSQDTATGLPHAEQLHDRVIRDWISLWVVPKLTGTTEVPGGWQCVFDNESARSECGSRLLPSKAALINKIRWTIFERKAAKQLTAANLQQQIVGVEESTRCQWRSTGEISMAVRKLFPYFISANHPKAFFENAGGSQVPLCVIESVTNSLSNRHRALIGAQLRDTAAETMSIILGASLDKYSMCFGSNATTLLSRLAGEYVASGRLTKTDEIIIATENHIANVAPWVEAAQTIGASIRWWHITPRTEPQSSLVELVTSNTRLVILSHASNILGELRDIRRMRETIQKVSSRAEIVVDGVATVPHVYADLNTIDVDWYAVSCHKLFGPHIGVLVGRKIIADNLRIELGTVNYEACAGISGLGHYFAKIANVLRGHSSEPDAASLILNHDVVKTAYRLIALVETHLTKLIFNFLSKSANVELLGSTRESTSTRIPVFSLRHSRLSNEAIITMCEEGGIIARQGTFLSCDKFQQDFRVNEGDGVVRLSLAHYSLPDEIQRLSKILETLPGW